ncbi:MAG: cytochrome c [Bacteroidetes bacterium]|nr:cytochrome c [Bacteroidota bacterium]MBS1649734.1 cytochrome c [Bacteroidota bacterium]
MKKIATIIVFTIITIVFVLAQQPNAMQQSVMRGKAVYTKFCLSCHQADGGGVPKLNPPLIVTEYINDKNKMIKIVLKGMTERIAIDDEKYSNNMAPHNNLTNQQIADVLTYVRNSFGNNAGAVTVAEVQAVRNKQ